MTSADLSFVNMAGANLSSTDLTRGRFNNTTLVSISPISFPVDLSYEDFIATLSNLDCLNGTFLTIAEEEIVPVQADLSEDLGREFFDSGQWRNAVLYICAADMSNIFIRGRITNPVYAAGVNFSGADLRSTDLSTVTFEDAITVVGLPYTLSANLDEIIYDRFTIWPPNFVPPNPTRE
jgi:uncharacterized protein YjbI with pentapeptide repeats